MYAVERNLPAPRASRQAGPPDNALAAQRRSLCLPAEVLAGRRRGRRLEECPCLPADLSDEVPARRDEGGSSPARGGPWRRTVPQRPRPHVRRRAPGRGRRHPCRGPPHFTRFFPRPKRGRESFAGTALRVLCTKDSRPPFGPFPFNRTRGCVLWAAWRRAMRSPFAGPGQEGKDAGLASHFASRLGH
jgi:hypothetical protein